MKWRNKLKIGKSISIISILIIGLIGIALAAGTSGMAGKAYTGCLSDHGKFYFFNVGLDPLHHCKKGDIQDSFYNRAFVDNIAIRVSIIENNTTNANINPETFEINTSHGNITLAQLAEIQPGLGTVMIEYATRFWSMYYAAKSGNWDLAEYQMKEQLEIQEVGEITRPARAPLLKSFESAFLVPLNNTINAKDFNAFQTAYNTTIDGCNGCHTAAGFGFIKYALPSSPPNIP